MTRAQRNFTDDEKAAVLATVVACTGNCAEAARTCQRNGLPVTERTVERWYADSPETVSVVSARKRAELRDMMVGIAHTGAGIEQRALDHLTTLPVADTIEHLSTVNRVTGTAIDKAALLGGEPTERVAHVVDLDLSHGD